jgi:hypothetical protein
VPVAVHSPWLLRSSRGPRRGLRRNGTPLR